MADTLSTEQRASYAAIIDEILASSNLETISAKRIRKSLQEKVPYDLTPQKDAIKDLTMERFDKITNQRNASTNGTATVPPEPAPTANGTGHVKEEDGDAADSPEPPSKKRKTDDEDDDDELSEVADSPPPTKKVKKEKVKTETETDEQYAARLQAELNAVQARATRGGGATRKKATIKKEKKPKKKSAAKLGAEDDSELEGSLSEKPEKEKKGGFHKLMNLSEPLSAMLGEPALSRPQTVKKIWEYVKERDLQDPSDKRQIRCDDAMRAVFKQDKVHMFTMNKLLVPHYYPQEE